MVEVGCRLWVVGASCGGLVKRSTKKKLKIKLNKKHTSFGPNNMFKHVVWAHDVVEVGCGLWAVGASCGG